MCQYDRETATDRNHAKEESHQRWSLRKVIGDVTQEVRTKQRTDRKDHDQQTKELRQKKYEVSIVVVS